MLQALLASRRAILSSRTTAQTRALTGAVFFDKKEVSALFGLVKIHCTRSAVIARVEIGPRQRHDEHGEHQNNSGNDDGGFCWHGYASFFGSGAMVMVKSHR